MSENINQGKEFNGNPGLIEKKISNDLFVSNDADEVKETKANAQTDDGRDFSKRLSFKKKFRLSEFLAEKIITSIAFLSITIIILIFVFVFRESMPIFFPEKQDNVEQMVSKSSSEIREDNNINRMNDKSQNEETPERYGLDFKEAPSEHNIESNDERNNEKPEVYGSVEKPEEYGSTEKSEVYGLTEKSKEMNNEQSENKRAESSSLEQGRLSSLSKESAGREGEISFQSLTGTEWQPVSDNPRYGLLPLFLGTFKLTLIAILIAAPIGILSALFTAAFAPKWLREIIKPAIEILAGFPSVVIGFFALMVMATFFQDLFGYGSRLNSFVGGVAMALAAIPIIYTITEDALTAVPNIYKEASLALGASNWQTAFFVTLPAATPGIFAAVLLGIGRVFGETMIALMATGNASLFTENPFDSVRALSATIGAEMAEVVFGDTHYNVLFLIGSLLFIFTFVLNVIAEFYVRGKLVKRFQGGKS